MHDLTGAADPVAAFRVAHERGEPVALRTAGSTRRPRRVVRTTGSWLSSFDAVSVLSGIDATARLWVPGPTTGSMNVFARVHAAWVGATLVDRMPAASHAVLTPTALQAALDGTVPAGLVVVVAGAAVGPGLAAQAQDAGLVVHHYYGAAELSFVAWGRDSTSLAPFPGVEVTVRDGEVWARSPYLCLGYDGPAGPMRRDPDGFATVGDRGAFEAGVLTLHGRPGTVTTGGTTVQVAEVESLLRSRARGEVVVLGIPHPRLGEVLGAVLTDPADHAPLLALARDQLVGAARPRRWWLADALPVTAAGKVDRAVLAQQAPTLPPLTASTVVP